MTHSYKDFRPPQYPDQIWNTRSDGSLDIGHVNDKPSLTQQQFASECDINNIMKSYVETGTINHKNPRPGIFGDFSDVRDFKESLELVQYANEQFMALPANVRSRFSNNPAELVEFCNNPNNLQEAISLGLAISPSKPQPINDDNSMTTNNSAAPQSVPKTKKSSPKNEPEE
ncbi:MAG: internal scaffolding protein [Arizlama microvirus]|nr:MAG: internal scaffolding protein [Arizlama microvirus]